MNDDSPKRPLVLKFGGSLVEQLGAQLYPSVTATVAELISNAWDADAKNVWVEIPFDEDWNNSNAQIVVTDDGHGMSREQAQSAYLVVGRRKRYGELGDRSEGGRKVHGRKGIGKLAAFGTAGYLECTTLRGDGVTAFGIDYNELRLLNPDQDYYVDPVDSPDPLLSPSGATLQHGTRVRLSKLRVKRKISSESFRLSMSRRFALKGMEVFINGLALAPFDLPIQFRFPRDGKPENVFVDEFGWAAETLDSGDKVRWWIGFTEKPLTDGDQQGISVLARQKMAQRPFKFEMSAGTTAQLGYEYLVGEVEANWLDQGDDIDTDYIQSNRDQIQVENPRLDEFMNWGRRRIAWALRERNSLRQNLIEDQAKSNPELSGIISDSSYPERMALQRVADKLLKVPEMEIATVNQIMKSVMESRAEAQLRRIAAEVEQIDSGTGDSIVTLANEIDSVDSERLASVIDARLEILTNLSKRIAAGKIVDKVQDFVRADLWLIDPRLHLLSQELDLDPKQLIGGAGQIRDLNSRLFVMAPDSRASLDEVFVICAVGSDPSVGPVSGEHFERFKELVLRVNDHYASRSSLPIVHGLMIAAEFELSTERVWREENVRVAFHTWTDALARSRALHLGWREALLKRQREVTR